MAFRFGQSPLRINPDLFGSPRRFSYLDEPDTGTPLIPSRPSTSLRELPRFRAPEAQYTPAQAIEDLGRQTVEPLAEGTDFDRLAGAYKPSFAAQTQYLDVLGQMPQRTRPGVWSGIFGALAGVGEGLQGRTQNIPKTMEQIMYAPYQRQLEDWKLKTQGYGEAAEIESKQNQMSTQWINAMSNLFNRESMATRRGEQTEIDRAKLDQKTTEMAQKVQIAEARNMRIVRGVDGNVYSVDPTSGNRLLIGPDSLYQLAVEKNAWQKAQGQGRLDVSRGQLGVAQGRLNVAQQGLGLRERGLDIAEARAEGYLNNIESLIADRTRKYDMPLSPLDEARELRNAINQTVLRNPAYREMLDDFGQIREDADEFEDMFPQFYAEIQQRLETRRNALRPGAPPKPTVPATITPKKPKTTTPKATPPSTINFSNLPPG